jgi:hypothetical protein
MISLLPFFLIWFSITFIMWFIARKLAKNGLMRCLIFLAICSLSIGQDTVTLALYGYKCAFEAGYGIQEIIPSRGIYTNSTLLIGAKHDLESGYQYVEFSNADGKVNVLSNSGLTQIKTPTSRIHVIYYNQKTLNVLTSGLVIKDTHSGNDIGWAKTASTAGGWLLSGTSRLLFHDPISMSCGGNQRKLGKNIVIAVAPPLSKDEINERK